MVIVRLLLLLALTTSVAAQGPPTPQVDLGGTWSLDVHLTDHPEQIARAIQFDTGEFVAEAFGRVAEGASDAAGRTGRAGRSGRGREPQEEQMSPEDRKLLAELVRPIQFPPPTLTIAQQDAAVTITAGGRAPDTLRPDGKAEKQTLEAGIVNRTAVWKGLGLDVAYEVGRAGVLTYTYSIVPTTKQLLIRVNFERLPGRPGPFEVKLVYNRAGTKA